MPGAAHRYGDRRAGEALLRRPQLGSRPQACHHLFQLLPAGDLAEVRRRRTHRRPPGVLEGSRGAGLQDAARVAASAQRLPCLGQPSPLPPACQPRRRASRLALVPHRAHRPTARAHALHHLPHAASGRRHHRRSAFRGRALLRHGGTARRHHRHLRLAGRREATGFRSAGHRPEAVTAIDRRTDSAHRRFHPRKRRGRGFRRSRP